MDWWIVLHIILVASGIIIASPLGGKISNAIGAGDNKMKWLSSRRERMLAGLLLVCLGGFTVSSHTLWFHNKFHEMGNSAIGCSAFSVFDCANVIANDDYNSAPLLGIPWGVVGMLAFAMLAWLALSIKKEPSAGWVDTHLKAGVGISTIGALVALYLVYVEIFPLEGVFCQYCTIAHIADIASLVIFFKLLNMKNEGIWLTDGEKSSDEKSKTLTEIRTGSKSRGGYVKPTSSGEEE